MSESPFYVEHKPMKNQGVFMGDGNQYRFSFSVYTGENIPGGVEGDTDLYYCFQFGDYYSQPVDFPGALDRCWIKKTAIESITGSDSSYSAYNIVVVKYQTGSIVLFYKGEPIGIIHNGPLSPEILWGVSITLSFPNYVYKDSDVAGLKNLLDTANSLGKTRFDKLSVIFKAKLLLDEDRLEYISKQEQIAYNDVRFVSNDYALHPILDGNGSLDELYIALPTSFRIEDYRTRTQNSEDDTLERPELSEDQDWIGGGIVESYPANTSALTFPLGFPGQYGSLTIDPITEEIIRVGDVIGTFGVMTNGYSTNILPLLQQDGDQVVLYMVLSLDQNKNFQTSLAHVYGQNPTVPEPESGSINQVLCTVRRYGFSFLLFTNNAYNRTVTSAVVTLKRPPDVDNLSIGRNSTNQLQIAGWEEKPIITEPIDMTQTEFVAKSGGKVVYVDLSKLMLEQDEVSIDKNTDDKLEIKGWSSKASIDTPADMTNLGFVCRDGTPEVNTLKFVKLDDLKTETEVDDVTIEKDTKNDDALQIKGFPSEDAVLLDFNDKGIQDGNENETEWAFLTRVTDGETDPYLQYTKHIVARYFLKGDEDNSLGVVRGVTAAEDETDDNPLVVRLAGVNETPGETTQQRVYAYSTDGKWGLYELEMLFQLDAINKRFYYNPQKYDTGAQLVLDHSAPTAKFDFEWDSNTYNSVKIKMLTASWKDETTGNLKVAYRNITLPKVLVSHVTAEDVVDLGAISGERPADPTTPIELGQNSEGSSDDAVSTAYDATAEEAPGLSIWVCTRMRYDHSAGTPKLYAYMSKLTFPAAIAPTVTGQTRVEIDTPELA